MLQQIKKLTTHQHYLTLLFVLITLKAIWAFFEISSGYLGLDPDEAQYWTWSQNMDFGFYSKPPGIAWQIWLGCKLFGNTELGVRSMAVLISMLTSLAIYFGGYKASFSPKMCFWSAAIFAFCPIGFMSTFAATTDGGFILFWTLALFPLFDALESKKAPNYLLIATFILVGALYKWPIYLLWAPIIIACLFNRSLYHKGLLNGMALSLAGLLPSVIWNSMHGWPTFRHVFTQTTTTANAGNFWEFFGAQFAILSPIYFVMLLLGIIEIARLRKTISKSLLFCSLTTLLILGAFLGLSSFKKIQANWALYAYPTATYIVAWYGLHSLKKGYRWLMRGVALSMVTVAVMVTIPYVQSHSTSLRKILPYSANPFRRTVGLNKLQEALREIDYQEDQNFLFADTYQMTSLLSFYGPVSKRQYFLNTQNKRQNQFCFWPVWLRKSWA